MQYIELWCEVFICILLWFLWIISQMNSIWTHHQQRRFLVHPHFSYGLSHNTFFHRTHRKYFKFFYVYPYYKRSLHFVTVVFVGVSCHSRHVFQRTPYDFPGRIESDDELHSYWDSTDHRLSDKYVHRYKSSHCRVGGCSPSDPPSPSMDQYRVLETYTSDFVPYDLWKNRVFRPYFPFDESLSTIQKYNDIHHGYRRGYHWRLRQCIWSQIYPSFWQRHSIRPHRPPPRNNVYHTVCRAPNRGAVLDA